MGNISWGRNTVTEEKTDFTSFKRLLILGCAAAVALVILSGDTKLKYAAVSADIQENPDNNGASAEPFGYFMGEWNLWEFIGDSVSSLFPSL